MARAKPIRLAAVSVALGLATTIGVAWGIPFRSRSLEKLGAPSAFSDGAVVLPFELWRGPGVEWAYRAWRAPIPIDDTDEMFDGYQYASHGVGYISATTIGGPCPPKRWKSLGPHPSHIPSPEPVWSEAFEPMCYQYAAGWPRPCLYCDWVTEDEVRFSLNPISHRGSMFALEGRRPLPIYPLWRKLLSNTALYASAWALLIGLVPVARAIRCRHRCRLGHCPRCAYDLVGIATRCPECGLPGPCLRRPEPAGMPPPGLAGTAPPD